jgi:hemerythrin-like metal-binding protein
MIEWDDKYSVGISRIDDEHKQFIDIINEAIATKEHNDDPEELREVLYNITMYAIKHFSTEENYMIEFKYPEYQYHKEEHHDFSKKAIEYCERVTHGDSQISNEILEYLKRWLVNHIQATDKKYVDCFKRNGLK